MRDKIVFTLVFLVGLCTYAQTNLNTYKYVVVPEKFDFLDEPDEYQMNSLTRFLLKKEGFTVIAEGTAYPDDLAKNNCLALYADVIDGSGLFVTKLSLELKDCRNNVVFNTEEGRSKLKEYRKAYQESLRDSFKGFNAISYKFDATAETASATNTVLEVEPKKDAETKPLLGNDKAPIETSETLAVKYIKDGRTFLLENKDDVLSLKDSANGIIQGSMQVSSKAGVYLFKSSDISGLAFMNENGDIVVEFIDANNEKSSTVYEKR